MAAAPAFRIGFLLFPRLTQLDLTGPYEILSRLPGARRQDARAGALRPRPRHHADDDARRLPAARPRLRAWRPRHQRHAGRCGNPRFSAANRRPRPLCHLRLHGVADLGRRRAPPGQARRLPLDVARPAAPLRRRAGVVIDGKFISGGGVTAGIDFALAVAAQLQGRETAEAIQLMVEYDPHPPFDAGTPERAAPAIVARVREHAAPFMCERDAAVGRAAAALGNA